MELMLVSMLDIILLLVECMQDSGITETYFDDVVQNKEYAKTKLTMPVLALGGDHSFGNLTLSLLHAVANDVRGGVVPKSGHFVAEENPDYVTRQLLIFFSQEKRFR